MRTNSYPHFYFKLEEKNILKLFDVACVYIKTIQCDTCIFHSLHTDRRIWCFESGKNMMVYYLQFHGTSLIENMSLCRASSFIKLGLSFTFERLTSMPTFGRLHFARNAITQYFRYRFNRSSLHHHRRVDIILHQRAINVYVVFAYYFGLIRLRYSHFGGRGSWTTY